MQIHSITDLNKNREPLKFEDIPDPEPDDGEVLLEVSVCGVCHTELDEIEGRTPPPFLPVVPGHQVIGTVKSMGAGTTGIKTGERVGVAWIYTACGSCELCEKGFENLCDLFTATGRDVDGGYAERMTVPFEFVYPIPDELKDEEAAPLLCAGAIGYRSLMLAGIGNGDRLGLTGFGASGHLVLRMMNYLYPENDVYIFARNPGERKFAIENGAVWVGDTEDISPDKLHAIIDTTPAWKPVVEALNNLMPAGRLVINAIRKEEFDKEYLMNLDYPEHLWMEKEVKSVANVARRDVKGMLQTAAKFNIRPDVRMYSLKDANKALWDLKHGTIRGAKVLRIN